MMTDGREIGKAIIRSIHFEIFEIVIVGCTEDAFPPKSREGHEDIIRPPLTLVIAIWLKRISMS